MTKGPTPEIQRTIERIADLCRSEDQHENDCLYRWELTKALLRAWLSLPQPHVVPVEDLPQPYEIEKDL